MQRSVHSDMWQAHPGWAFVLRFLATAVPIAVSVAIAVLAARLLPIPVGWGESIAWWFAVVSTATLGLVATDRVARRLLPLAVLLELSLLFPDKAPSRLAMVRVSGSSRDVARRVSEARKRGVDSEPVRAAESLVTLVGLLGLHDRRTRGHSERVRVYTDLISDELNLSRIERGKLRWAALLHDFGKLSVPPAILNKDGKPDKSEWELLYRHPEEGMRLAAGLVPWLGEWACAIGEHHEKYDGSGYPAGLSGQEIGLGARIVAVADAYEVMTAPRSYKRPMNAAAAREELTRCAGSHFDPVIVRAFLNVSLGRLRWYLGPLSWLTQGPVVASFDKARHVLGEAAAVGAAAVVTGAAIVAPAAGPLSGITDEGHAQASTAGPVYGPHRSEVRSDLALGWTSSLRSGQSAPVSSTDAPVRATTTRSVDRLPIVAAPRPPAPAPAAGREPTTVTPARQPAPAPEQADVAEPVSPARSGSAKPGPAQQTVERRLYLSAVTSDGGRTFQLSSTPPSSAGVPDVDGDGTPGLTLAQSRQLAHDPDARVRPAWQLSSGSAMTLAGAVTVTFTSKLATGHGPGTVRAYLQDCGTGCTTIATARTHAGRWSPGGWTTRTLDFGSVSHEVVAGHRLQVVIVVDDRGTKQAITAVVGSASYPSVLTLTTR